MTLTLAMPAAPVPSASTGISSVDPSSQPFELRARSAGLEERTPTLEVLEDTLRSGLEEDVEDFPLGEENYARLGWLREQVRLTTGADPFDETQGGLLFAGDNKVWFENDDLKIWVAPPTIERERLVRELYGKHWPTVFLIRFKNQAAWRGDRVQIFPGPSLRKFVFEELHSPWKPVYVTVRVTDLEQATGLAGVRQMVRMVRVSDEDEDDLILDVASFSPEETQKLVPAVLAVAVALAEDHVLPIPPAGLEEPEAPSGRGGGASPTGLAEVQSRPGRAPGQSPFQTESAVVNPASAPSSAAQKQGTKNTDSKEAPPETEGQQVEGLPAEEGPDNQSGPGDGGHIRQDRGAPLPLSAGQSQHPAPLISNSTTTFRGDLLDVSGENDFPIYSNLSYGLYKVNIDFAGIPAAGLEEQGVAIEGLVVPWTGNRMTWYSIDGLVPTALMDILDPAQERIAVPLSRVSAQTTLFVQEKDGVPIIPLEIMAGLEETGVEVERFDLDDVPQGDPKRENVYLLNVPGGREREFVLDPGAIVINFPSDGPIAQLSGLEELGALINVARVADQRVLPVRGIRRSAFQNSIIAVDTQL